MQLLLTGVMSNIFVDFPTFSFTAALHFGTVLCYCVLTSDFCTLCVSASTELQVDLDQIPPCAVTAVVCVNSAGTTDGLGLLLEII